LHLQNWENIIDNIISKNEKLQAVNNAIFELRKDLLNESHTEIIENINKTILHLEAIEKYINSNYIENFKNQLIIGQCDTIKYKAKHYLLAYLFECNAKGESYPMGNKKELERIGNERMGAGKGNRFYKVFNEIINKDLNFVNNLIEIGGENWRKAVIELSNAPELVEKYLKNKQL